MSRTDETVDTLAFYVPTLLVGGAEQVTISIANGLADRGHDVELVVSNPCGKLRSNIVDAVSVEILGNRHIPLFGIAAHVPSLASYLQRRRPAALFSQMTHANVVCLLAHRFGPEDTLTFPTEHSPFALKKATSLKSRAIRSLAIQLLPTADQLIAVSDGVADSLVSGASVPEQRVSVLHNPVDVGNIREVAGEPVSHDWLNDESLDVVLSVGRIEKQKDLQSWLEAFVEINQRRPRTRGIIAGEGSQQETLRALAEEYGVEDVVSIPGYVENQYAYMRRADVFLLSSRYEGLPTVLIEALACGCPVVATDCPAGPREILVDGKYGPLVPVGSVEKMADAVIETLEEPPEPSKLTSRAGDFAPDVVLERYERFIESHIEGYQPQKGGSRSVGEIHSR